MFSLSGLLVPFLLAGQAPAGGFPLDSKDGQPVLLGISSREQILAHREIYRQNTRRTELTPEWKARWGAIAAPCTLVVAFGSWCGDSQRELPDLLALLAEPSPFVTVHFIGVGRDKQARPEWWPEGIAAQRVEKVPTIWGFSLQPGGGQALAGMIVENPPVKGQRMAEAILDLLERASR